MFATFSGPTAIRYQMQQLQQQKHGQQVQTFVNMLYAALCIATHASDVAPKNV